MSEPLAEARVLIVPDLTGFRTALAAEVTKATATAVPVAARAATATREVSVAQLEGAKAARANAAANLEVANVFTAVAASARLEQKALLATAAAHEAASRGALTTGLSFAGLRGATLAASKGFIIGAAAAITAKKSVEEYSAESEAAARVQAILGTSLGRSVEEWGHQQAAIGLSTEAALKYAGAIEQVFKNVNIASEENAKFSEQLVTRAVDVAARSNVPVTTVLRAFQLALSGNLRGLRQFVPAVDAATIAQRALADTGKETKASLTTQELVLARYEVILDKSANQAGAFAERQGHLAAQSKILQSNLANLAATLGGPIATALTVAVRGVNELFTGFHKLNQIVGSLPDIPFLDDSTFNRLREFKQQEDAINQSLNIISQSVAGVALAGQFDVATNSARSLLNVLGAIASTLGSGFGARLTNIQEGILQTQIGGGSLQDVAAQQKVAVAAAQGAATAAILRAAVTAGRTGGDTAVKQRRDAEQAVKQAQDALSATQAAIAAAGKGAGGGGGGGGAAKGPTAQEIRDRQDQALLTAQQLAQGQVEILKAHAQTTKSLADDVAALRTEAALTARQIVEAQKIHDDNNRLQTIQQLTLKLIQTQADIEDAQAEILQRRRQRLIDRADARVQLASLDAQIAETRGSKQAQIRALLKENAALELERRLWRGNTVKQKEITLQIAQNTAQIKELRKQKDKNKDAGASLAFQFLQTQQGFAANLLSNLLPTSAVAGTVGGGAISTATAAPFVGNPLPPPGTGFPGGISGDVSSSAQISAGARGASAGQMSTLIHIQRLMLAHIAGGSQRTAHPEAARNWAYSATEMLNTGW